MRSALSNQRRRAVAALAVGSMASLALSSCSVGGLLSGEEEAGKTNLTFLVPNAEDDLVPAQALVKAFESDHPEINIEIETRPGGTEGDNIVKTRLSTGDMPEIFQYNNGSLFHAIDPVQNLVPLSDEPFVDRLPESFTATVSEGGDVYGAPWSTAMGGGVLYNKEVYEKLDLEVPMTWDEFMANNAEIKQSGIAAPVIQTYGETWTAQLFVLGDFHNVAAVDPNWAQEYTSGDAKYATPPAIDGFLHQQAVNDAGYMNKDFASAELVDGLRMIATGEGAHYPMLTQVISTIAQDYPKELKDVGFFALPGEDASENGLTIWPGFGVYIPKTTEGEELEASKQFLDFIASKDGCETQSRAVSPPGPYLVEGCELPADVAPAVKDMLPYFQSDDRTTPALEYLSPVKGPALEQITVEVGSGIRSAEEGAALYDEDVEKQAQQLGLPGW
jgi:raffinose/stachyose/melibiose transport system substrate-binding protein